MPLSLPSAAFPEDLLAPLLAISLTGVNLLRPLYDPAGILADFAIEYLNPAGQRLTGLPERPGGTLRTHFPHALAAGIVPFYCRVFETGQTDTYEVNYQADGVDNYFRLAAQRHGEWLVVSFTDNADQSRNSMRHAGYPCHDEPLSPSDGPRRGDRRDTDLSSGLKPLQAG